MRCKVQSISSAVSCLSILCSLVSMSLFSVIFFWPTLILDYRSMRLVVESAHYLVVTAVILFCLAFILSFFKDSPRNPIALQKSMSEKSPLENSYTLNGKIDNSKSFKGKIKTSQCNKEDKMVENSKPLITPSKNSHAITSPNQIETGKKTISREIESQNSNEKLSQTNNQLVPYKKPTNSLYKQNIPTAFSLQLPNFWKSMPINKPGNNLATEVTTTRKVAFFPGGFAQSQEDIKIRRTTFFRCPENRISSVETVETKFNPNSDKFRMDLSIFKDPRVNQISDVLTKFDSMNILQ